MGPEIAATAKTFPVADVEPASSPLEETPYQDALEGLLTAERLTKGKAYRPTEAFSRRESRLVDGIDYHPLVAALHLAYAGHRPIALSPDMIWLLICQGVAHHISASAEELRHHFVQHPGRFTLEVKSDEVTRFKRGSPGHPWPEVFGGFSRQIREHIGPAHDLFIPAFSTTGPAERVAAEIVLLDTMRAYFHYLHTTVNSGIPAVTLEGTLADWQAIVERLEGFAPLGLEWWLAALRPVLRQFADAASGEVDTGFWSKIYRIHQPDEFCAPDSATGWICILFPYLTNGHGATTLRNPWLSGVHSLDDLLDPARLEKPDWWSQSPETGTVTEDQLPSGLAKAAFVWDERYPDGRLAYRWDMELLGGFIGVAQNPQTLDLRPEIGWAVRQRVPPA
jgi:hypothetical protein